MAHFANAIHETQQDEDKANRRGSRTNRSRLDPNMKLTEEDENLLKAELAGENSLNLEKFADFLSHKDKVSPSNLKLVMKKAKATEEAAKKAKAKQVIEAARRCLAEAERRRHMGGQF